MSGLLARLSGSSVWAQGVLGCGAGALIWLLEVRAPTRGTQLVGVILAVLALMWVATHVRAALICLLVYVPLQQPLLAYLYAQGVPGAVVRNLGFVKEIVVLGAVLAALRAARDRPWKLQAVDQLVLLYVTLLGLFTTVPLAIPGALGGQPLAVLALSFRTDCLFLILFFACRRLPWSTRDVRVLAVAWIVPAVSMSIPVLWERYAVEDFLRFTFETLQLPTYIQEVLNGTFPASFRAARLGGGQEIRAGGWFTTRSRSAST